MEPDLEKGIQEITLRMRLLRAMQEDGSSSEGLTERDVMILGLLGDRGRMSVSEIAAANPTVSDSTISTNITKLWREKKMVSKTISPKGRKAIEVVNKQRTERFKALFEAIKVTEQEKQVLIKVLTRATAFFDKYLGLDKSIND